jgi:hypothetical protein
MGKINSIKSRLLVKALMCTLLDILTVWHIIMQHVKEKIASGASRFDVEDLVVNLLFDKSTKRKNELNDNIYRIYHP